MSWRATDLSTNPASLQVATTELLAVEFDTTLDLADGESVSAVSTRLLRLDTVATVTLSDTPEVADDVLTQIIDGSVLERGITYELTWTYEIAPSKVLSRTTVFVVVA